MRYQEGDQYPVDHQVGTRVPVASNSPDVAHFLFRSPESLFEQRKDGTVQSREFLTDIVMSLQRNLGSIAHMSVDEGDVRLQQRSGMVRHLIHLPQAYAMIPLTLSHLDEAFALRDRARLRNTNPYYGSRLYSAMQPLIRRSCNCDIHLAPRRKFLDDEKKEKEAWCFAVSGAIVISLRDVVSRMGYTPADWMHDVRGDWYFKSDEYTRIQLTGDRIPGTRRWSYGLQFHDVRVDEHRPPRVSIQVQLDPVDETEALVDRRTGDDVNRRQQIVQYIRQLDGAVGISRDELNNTRDVLRLPDRLAVLPANVPKHLVTLERISRMAAELMMSNRGGERLLPLPTTRKAFDQIVVERDTQEAVRTRMEVLGSGGSVLRFLEPEQKNELVKDILVLMQFFGPFAWRTFLALGGGELFDDRCCGTIDWSPEALKRDIREHEHLEGMYRMAEDALLAGGPAAYEASRKITAFCVNATLRRLLHPSLVREVTGFGLQKKLHYLTELFK